MGIECKLQDIELILSIFPNDILCLFYLFELEAG